MVVEGTIVRTCRIGLFVDVHAEVLGLLPWRALRGLPKKYIQKGAALGNLEVSKASWGSPQKEKQKRSRLAKPPTP
eukprot:5517441-Amphidinium_carterae.1